MFTLKVFLENHRSFFQRIFFLFCLMVFLCYLYFSSSFIYPFSIEFGEGLVVYLSQQFADSFSFHALYSPLAVEPYVANPYPPLYFIISAPFVRLINFSPFIIVRLISILFLIGAALVIYCILDIINVNKSLSIAGALLFLLSSNISSWGHLARVDIMALFFSLLSFFYLLRQKNHFCLTFALLAIFTKPTFLSVWLICFFSLIFLERLNMRKILQIALVNLGIGLFMFIGLDIITGGSFVENVISANLLRYSFESVFNNFLFFIITWPGILFIFLLFFIFFFYSDWKSYLRIANHKIIFWYFILSLVLNLILSGKAGSSYNFLLEPHAIFLLLVMSLLLFVWQKRKSSSLLFWGTLVFVAASVVVSLFYGSILTWQLIRATPYNSTVFVDSIGLEAILTSRQGDYLSDNPDFAFLAKSGQRFFMVDSFLFSTLAKVGKWDSKPIIAKIADKEFKAILLDNTEIEDKINDPFYERLPQEVLLEIKENYKLHLTMANKFFYLPN